MCVVAQYLHETAAFSFSADKKACGDTGDLTGEKKKREAEERRETKRVRGGRER